MSSVRVEELRPASGTCPVSGRQNFFLRKGHVQGRTLSSVGSMSSVRSMSSGYEAELSSFVRDMSSRRVTEICPASGACPVCGWQYSVVHQG
ncbi:hypothetical protein TNIN_297541 [Trichonephila inaurata madagascariensis]|uniref:Uncharacterized protein n=1 Tax=Trichonephila inaurata madagascariensis TaxID=2747483 RepID=A0A8X7BUE3_9ARAC|nr:hypothetical protein TNIN_297541 [Trichonephila inaurata madagascariensis]